MVSVRYFFSDGRRGAPSSAPKSGSLVEVLDAMTAIPPRKGNFFGVVTDEGTLQFYAEGDGEWTVDVPVPAQRGSLQRRIRSEDMERLVREVVGGVPPAELSGLVLSPW